MMTKKKLFGLSIVAVGMLAATGSAFADSTWGATNCNAGCVGTQSGSTAATGAKLSIGYYYADLVDSKFAVGTRTAASGYYGVQSMESGVNETTAEPHHSIDNYGIYTSASNPVSYASGMSTSQKTTADKNGGADYAEMLYLNFDKGVSLNKITSSYVYSGGDADFQVYAYIGSAAIVDLGTYTATSLMGSADWKLVSTTSGDFAINASQAVGNGTTFSSYWVVTTAFGGYNDSFKLSSFSAAACADTVIGGECKKPPPGPEVPEPASLALFAAAALGAGAARRRSAAKSV